MEQQDPRQHPDSIPLENRKFEVPDFGTVGGHNAIFVHFLQKIWTRRGDEIGRLEDVRRGHSVWCRFQSGAGKDELLVTRIY